MAAKETFHLKIQKILCEHGPLKVSDIYRFIEASASPGVLQKNKNWRNSVRHALSSKKNLFAKASHLHGQRGHSWGYFPTPSKRPIRPLHREPTHGPVSQVSNRTYNAILNYYKFLYVDELNF